MSYLNAHKAPHWMQMFNPGQARSPVTPGWYTTQTGADGSNSSERWATSWARDLMVAANYAPMALSAGNAGPNGQGIRMVATTDANLARTPFMHASHDLGMAMDLGINDWVHPDVPAITIPAGPAHWSLQRAVDLTGLLNAANTGPRPTELHPNNQRDMTRAFLSMYWATKEDMKAGERWLITGTANDADRQTIQNALFRAGDAQRNPQSTASLIKDVQVLNALGIASRPVVVHHHHFHIGIVPPGVQAIRSSQNLLTEAAPVQRLDILSEAEAEPIQQALLVAKALPKADRVVKTCMNYNEFDPKEFSPGGDASYIMGRMMPKSKGETDAQWYARREVAWTPTKVTLVETPKHVSFVEIDGDGYGYVRFEVPAELMVDDDRATGRDVASFLVEFPNGKRVLMRYEFRYSHNDGKTLPCKPTLLGQWNLDAVTAGQIGPYHFNAWQTQSHLSALLAAASVVHTELAITLAPQVQGLFADAVLLGDLRHR